MENGTKSQSKPVVKLLGEDGNVFNLIGLTTRALRKAGQADKAAEFQKCAFASGSYDAVLVLTGEYCDVH